MQLLALQQRLEVDGGRDSVPEIFDDCNFTNPKFHL